jgi:endoglucanase
MDRVETVVDEALATGAYVILNAHHDSWIWADVTAAGANYTEIEERFGRLWSQIGTRFACKPSKLIFEPINEPPGTTQAHADELNKLEGIFLTSINEAGGHNPQRVVSLCGMSMNAALTAQFFVRGPLYPNQPWGLQFHYYSPYDFIFSAWGKTIWGSDADKASLLNDFQLFYGNFTTVPAFVGEFDASPANTETAGRWKWFDYITRVAKSFDYSLIVWDNGADHFNRSADTWNDPVVIDIWFDAIFGENNTLADSTTDPTALTQFSSAYIFHEVGTPVVAETATYLLNGNHFLSIETAAGVRLNPSQYSFSSNGTLTLSASYLSTLYTSTSAPGVLETLTLCFSEGSSLSLTIVQYGLPVVSQTTWNITTQLATGLDLWIPITWAGLPEPAAVKAILADGTYMVDTWTVYLPPLQQACWTEGDWSWNAGGQDNFVVTQAGLGVMQASGEDVTLTVEVCSVRFSFVDFSLHFESTWNLY